MALVLVPSPDAGVDNVDGRHRIFAEERAERSIVDQPQTRVG